MLKNKLDLDGLEGAKGELWAELVEASGRMAENPLKLDGRTTQIIAAHFSLEREMELAFARLIARPDELKRLGYGHKVALLKALLDDPLMDRTAEQLLAFNELRNAAAHPRNPDLEPLIRKLRNLCEIVEAHNGDHTEIDEILRKDLGGDVAIISYAAIITARLQMVLGMASMLHAALSVVET